MRGEGCQHCRGILRPWPVIESEHHFAFPQEVMALEMLKAKTGTACRVYLDHPRTPSASGLPGHEEPARAGAGDAGSAAAAGTCGAADVGATATVEELRTPTVGLLGATPEVKAGFAADSLAGGAPCSAIVVTTARAEPSVDPV